MRTPKSWRAALAVLATAAGVAGAVAVPRGTAQTLYPYIYGISTQGETCSGWCYAGPRGGTYMCCRITTPAPPAE